MQPWFPKFFPDGSWVGGDLTLIKNGVDIKCPGRAPQPQADGSILCGAPTGPGLWRWTPRDGRYDFTIVKADANANILTANLLGEWVYEEGPPGGPRLIAGALDETAIAIFPLEVMPAISAGGLLASIRHGDGALLLQGESFTTTNSASPKFSRAGVLGWTQYSAGGPAPYISRDRLERWSVRVGPSEFLVGLAEGAGGLWVLTQQEERLLLRLAGEHEGYILDTQGQTYFPDILALDSQIRVICTTNNGVFREFRIDTAKDPRVSLVPPVVVVPTPTPIPEVPPAPPEERPSMSISIKTFNLRDVTVHRDAPDIFSWPVTSKVAKASSKGDQLTLEHTRSGQWPEEPYEDIKVEGVLWVIAQTPKGLRAATIDRLRPGQTQKQMRVDHYGEPYALDVPGWNPAPGDIIALMASTPARSDERGRVQERSEIAFVKFGTGEFLGVWPETPGQPIPQPPPDPDPIDQDEVVRLLEAIVDTLVDGMGAMQQRFSSVDAGMAILKDGSAQERKDLGVLEERMADLEVKVDSIQKDQHSFQGALLLKLEQIRIDILARIDRGVPFKLKL